MVASNGSDDGGSSGPGPSIRWNSGLINMIGCLLLLWFLVMCLLLKLICCSRPKPSEPDLFIDVGEVAEQQQQQQLEHKGANSVAEPQFLVIMAGEQNPSFIATPVRPAGAQVCEAV